MSELGPGVKFSDYLSGDDLIKYQKVRIEALLIEIERLRSALDEALKAVDGIIEVATPRPGQLMPQQFDGAMAVIKVINHGMTQLRQALNRNPADEVSK